MKHLLKLVYLLIQAERVAIWRGFALAMTVLGMGVALLGLSGWFITASAAAGMAGIGILFNVFAPSAMVRFLALGRTAARYGERLLTHDATLRALSQLRIRLLQGLLTRPYRELERLRASSFLNRVTADIDALDGALLRLVLPAAAGGAVIIMSAVALWFLVHPWIAMVICVGYLALPSLVFVIGQHCARRPARQGEAALQASRSRMIDLIAGRDDLTVYGQLHVASDHIRAAFARISDARLRLDRIERRTGAGLDLIGAILVAAALGIGTTLVQQGEISAAQAAISMFAALALTEAVAPVRRALTEIGRMTLAARRVLPAVASKDDHVGIDTTPQAPGLEFRAVGFHHKEGVGDLFSHLDLAVLPGESVALTGASGSGKSTVLLLAAGALAPTSGHVIWGGQEISSWSRKTLGRHVALVPQRHALIGGSVRENLLIAAPDATDEQLWQVLELASLAQTIQNRGGLDTMLGFRGAGLSGGEARRLVLARVLLRHPSLLLLDEPTEGLDQETARSVMANVRRALPDAAILVAAHRPAEIQFADRSITISRPVD